LAGTPVRVGRHRWLIASPCEICEMIAVGRTVVEHFVTEHPGLSEEERAVLLGWRAVVEGIFRVRRRDGDALVAVNLVDELTYRVRSNRGPAALASMRHGTFLIARLVPIGQEWLLSGASTVLPTVSRCEAYRLAAELAAKRPALVFRNPERLAWGRERQREERRHFIAFFGSDLVVLSGDELAARMAAYWRFRMHEVRDAEGRSAADHLGERYGAAAQLPEFDLPADLGEADTVGVVYDEVEGTISGLISVCFRRCSPTRRLPPVGGIGRRCWGTWRRRASRRWRCGGWPSRILSGRAGCCGGCCGDRDSRGGGTVRRCCGSTRRAGSSGRCCPASRPSARCWASITDRRAGRAGVGSEADGRIDGIGT